MPFPIGKSMAYKGICYSFPTKTDLEPLAHVYFLPEIDTDVKQIKPRAPPEATFLTI
jgi:hypothetical protein